MSKKIVQINVEIEEDFEKDILDFTKNGGIYRNINNGIIQEPLMPQYLSKILGCEVTYANSKDKNNACDFICEKGKIEHKGTTITKKDKYAGTYGFRNKEGKSDYISIYNLFNKTIYVISSLIFFEEAKFTYNKTTNNLYFIFKSNMEIDNKNNNVSHNTKILLNNSLKLKIK